MTKKTEYSVEFHFGARSVKKFDLYVAAIFLSLAVRIAVRFLKVSPLDVWAIIDEIGKQYKIKLINELILRVPELLDDRIKREVDRAIADYKNVVEWEESKIEPIFTEDEEGSTPLGGEMRLRAPWLDNDE